MNDRKTHVINTAHQLFVEKGFQATSIQDILEHSGISKGTFYNYFSSKNELLIALFKTIYQKLDHDRNELLIGQDPSNIEIFIKQIELHLRTNRGNNLISLFEEVITSNDKELNQFLKQYQLNHVRWLYRRFIDIFGESKIPYLLDCAIMFMGILQHNLKYNAMAYGSNTNINKIVEYCVDRLVKMVDEVTKSSVQLIQPEMLDNWLPDCKTTEQDFQHMVTKTVMEIKQALNQNEEHAKYMELLDFIQEELLNTKNPREFLIESALSTLNADKVSSWKKELKKLDQLVAVHFSPKN